MPKGTDNIFEFSGVVVVDRKFFDVHCSSEDCFGKAVVIGQYLHGELHGTRYYLKLVVFEGGSSGGLAAPDALRRNVEQLQRDTFESGDRVLSS